MNLFLVFVLIFASCQKIFYVDPVNGNITNDGSFGSPLSTLEEVFDNGLIRSRTPISHPFGRGPDGAEEDGVLEDKNPSGTIGPGDTIQLLNGHHGDGISFRNYYNQDWVTIENYPGHKPTVGKLDLLANSKWIIRGLTISPSLGSVYSKETLVTVTGDGHHGKSADIVVENCTMYSVLDTSSWGVTEWNDLPCEGIFLRAGKRYVARNNLVFNVNFGITTYYTKEVLIVGNTVDGFAGDGIRALGDYCTYQYNSILNCYDVNANHDDGIQSWSYDPQGTGNGVGQSTVRGVLCRKNYIRNFEEKRKFIGALQGIVEKNFVYVDHYHGITFSGANDMLLLKNIILDCNTTNNMNPWMRIGDHKNGGKSYRNRLFGNYAYSYHMDVSGSYGNELDLNNIVDNLNHTYYINLANRMIEEPLNGVSRDKLAYIHPNFQKYY